MNAETTTPEVMPAPPPPLPERRDGDGRRGVLGTVVRAVGDTLFGSGRRNYDKRRFGIMLALIAIVQFTTQTGSALIHEMFGAYRAIAEAAQKEGLEERRREHTESIAVQRETAAAIRQLADEVRTNSETMRRALWEKERKR